MLSVTAAWVMGLSSACYINTCFCEVMKSHTNYREQYKLSVVSCMFQTDTIIKIVHTFNEFIHALFYQHIKKGWVE